MVPAGATVQAAVMGFARGWSRTKVVENSATQWLSNFSSFYQEKKQKTSEPTIVGLIAKKAKKIQGQNGRTKSLTTY